jgi:hypothetical protein
MIRLMAKNVFKAIATIARHHFRVTVEGKPPRCRGCNDYWRGVDESLDEWGRCPACAEQCGHR